MSTGKSVKPLRNEVRGPCAAGEGYVDLNPHQLVRRAWVADEPNRPLGNNF